MVRAQVIALVFGFLPTFGFVSFSFAILAVCGDVTLGLLHFPGDSDVEPKFV
jgi:hypothetical protein